MISFQIILFTCQRNLDKKYLKIKSLTVEADNSNVYMSLTAAVTNYYQLGGLKQKKCILSRFWTPDVQDQYHWGEIKMAAGQSSSKDSRGESAPCLFQLLLATGIPCFIATSV